MNGSTMKISIGLTILGMILGSYTWVIMTFALKSDVTELKIDVKTIRHNMVRMCERQGLDWQEVR